MDNNYLYAGARIRVLENALVGQERLERELEKAVQGAAPGIDGCDAGRCQYHVLLPCVATDILQ